MGDREPRLEAGCNAICDGAQAGRTRDTDGGAAGGEQPKKEHWIPVQTSAAAVIAIELTPLLLESVGPSPLPRCHSRHVCSRPQRSLPPHGALTKPHPHCPQANRATALVDGAGLATSHATARHITGSWSPRVHASRQANSGTAPNKTDTHYHPPLMFGCFFPSPPFSQRHCTPTRGLFSPCLSNVCSQGCPGCQW